MDNTDLYVLLGYNEWGATALIRSWHDHFDLLGIWKIRVSALDYIIELDDDEGEYLLRRVPFNEGLEAIESEMQFKLTAEELTLCGVLKERLGDKK